MIGDMNGNLTEVHYEDQEFVTLEVTKQEGEIVWGLLQQAHTRYVDRAELLVRSIPPQQGTMYHPNREMAASHIKEAEAYANLMARVKAQL